MHSTPAVQDLSSLNTSCACKVYPVCSQFNGKYNYTVHDKYTQWRTVAQCTCIVHFQFTKLCTFQVQYTLFIPGLVYSTAYTESAQVIEITFHTTKALSGALRL